jgi:hypothetical protein
MVVSAVGDHPFVLSTFRVFAIDQLADSNSIPARGHESMLA